jgi:hypothetical protein
VENRTTPLQAIKKHCYDCSGDDRKEVKDCNLYRFRFGKNPRLVELSKVKNNLENGGFLGQEIVKKAV